MGWAVGRATFPIERVDFDRRDIRRSCGLARLGLPANQDTLRWTHASSTWIRDHFGSVLEAVDTDGQPLLITRRGHCGLMLLARRVFEAHWNLSITVRDSRSEEPIGSNLATDPRMRLCKAGARARATADFRLQFSP